MFLERSINETFPVDTGRKLNVHKTFRGRSRHLLNVLCTFNLRPVSTGLLRILTGKKHTKIKPQRLRKIRIWKFVSLVHRINSF